MVVAVMAVLATTVATASASTRHGDLTFPQDENAQAASWDYWWGAGRLVTKSGNRYVVGVAFTSFDGEMIAGYQLHPLQGPYKGKSIMSMEGPPEWGHGEQPPGKYVYKMTANVPGTAQRLSLDTFDSSDGMKLISRWERINLKRESYRFTLNQDAAKIHPDDKRVPLRMNLRADMRSPLLAGGDGRWFYGVPEDFGFPSRAYQYQQATKKLTGTFTVRQPDGSTLRERVDHKRSSLFMVHESNPPEAIPVGLGLALATQVHARYVQSYNLQWPWELIYADLGNGAQLMFDLQAYHDTPRGLDQADQQPAHLPGAVHAPAAGRHVGALGRQAQRPAPGSPDPRRHRECNRQRHVQPVDAELEVPGQLSWREGGHAQRQEGQGAGVRSGPGAAVEQERPAA